MLSLLPIADINYNVNGRINGEQGTEKDKRQNDREIMEVPSRISDKDRGKTQKPEVMIIDSLAEPGHSRIKAKSQLYLSHDQSCSQYSNKFPPLSPCQTQFSSSSHNRVPLSICIAIGFHSPRRTQIGGSAYGFRVLIFETKSITSRKYFMLTDSA
jgi:hypothetical protein